MSEGAPQSNLSTQQPLQPTDPNTGSGNARTLRGAGLKYGDSDPVEDWAKGKTADEIYEFARQSRQREMNLLANQAPLTPPNPGAFSRQPTPPDPQLALTDYAAYQNQLLAYNNAQQQAFFQQQAQPYAQSLAQMARNQSQNDPRYAEVWKQFGHEIDANMSVVPFEQRTLDAYTLVAKMVKGEHADELIAKGSEARAQQLLSQRGLGTESGSGIPSQGAVIGGSALDQFLTSDHPKAQKYREVGKDSIRNYIKQSGITEEKWVEDVTNGRSFAASGAN